MSQPFLLNSRALAYGLIILVTPFLFLTLPPTSAQAVDNRVEVTIHPVWQQSKSAISWSPYEITVTNSSLQPLLADIELIPHEKVNDDAGTGHYKYSIQVSRSDKKTVWIYLPLLDNGWDVSVINDKGLKLASASSINPPNPLYAGVLSDSDNTSLALSSVVPHHFQTIPFTVSTLPDSANLLVGLSLLVVSDIDSAKLSSAQSRAIVDYVAFGGKLILLGGEKWRTRFGALPTSILPLRCTQSGQLRLNAISQLSGTANTNAVPGCWGSADSGNVRMSDRVHPLMVTSTIGGGKVVQFAIDISVEPLNSSPLSSLAWNFAFDELNMALDTLRFNSTNEPLELASAEGHIGFLLASPPARIFPSSLPLILLLLLYVALIGPVRYRLWPKKWRGGLGWALVFLVGVGGFASESVWATKFPGQDVLVNQLQVLRASPTGDVQVLNYNLLFAPNNSTYVIESSNNTFYSNGVLPLPVVDVAKSTFNSHQAILNSLTFETPRGFKNLEMDSAHMTVTTNLKTSIQPGLSGSNTAGEEIVGTISNTSNESFAHLQIYNGKGMVADIAEALPPNSTLTVKAPLLPLAQEAYPPYKRSSPRQMEQSVSKLLGNGSYLIATTRPLGEIHFANGGTPTVSKMAVLAQQVELQTGSEVQTPLVSTPYDGGWKNIYEVSNEKNYKTLTATSLPGARSHIVPTLEVYNWTNDTWRNIEFDAQNDNKISLEHGELTNRVVRIRVIESTPPSFEFNMGEGS